FYLALNTSTYDNILNDAAILLPIFDKNITINNGTENTTYDLNSNTTFSNEAIPLHYNNQLIAIQAIVDNEDLKLKLLFAKSNYTNGLYVNSSWSDSNEDGSSWNSPFQNLNAALKAIIDNKLNSTNCNFTIHIAGNLSSDDYTGDGVNVNLDLNSSYSNLTIIGEYGNAIFNGESQSRIFTISGNNISLENIVFKNGKDNYGGAIYNTGNNTKVMNSIFNNNSVSYYGGAIENYGHNFSISDSNFNDNSASSSGAISNSGHNFSISGSNFTDNFANYGYGGAISNIGGHNVSISGSNFNDNSATGSGGAIYNSGGNGFNITDSNFNSNLANIGGAIYIGYYSMGLIRNVTIISNNFVNNTNTTIFANNINNIQINHNRIYDMDKNHIAVNMTNDTIMDDVNWDLDYNWWGNNTPDTNYNGLNNYFVVNVIKNNLTNYLYTIRLNGSDNDSEFENKLPSFNGAIYLDYGDGNDVFDSNFNGNNSQQLNITIAQIAIFTVDDWTSEISNNIVINVNNLSGSKYGEIVILNASINAFDGNNTGIEVIFYINGEIIGSNMTDNLGNAYYHYKVPFIGNFIYNLSNNDSNHISTNSSEIYGEFIKSNSNITINSNLNGSKYGDTLILNTTLLDEFNNPLDGFNINFYIDNVFIGSNVTDSNGIAIFDYVVNFTGDYNFTVIFNGNDNYNGNNSSVFGDFAKADSNIIINSNINGSKYGDNLILNATVLDKYGNLLNSVNVEFYVDGVFIGSNVTDSNGIAIYNYVVGFVGNYNLTVCFNGTDNYNGYNVSVFGDFIKVDSNININFNPNGSKYGDNVILNATLFDEYGNCLNGGIVDFYINGEFIGSNVTDSNGIAIFDYVVNFTGDYNLTVVFIGNNNYNNRSVFVFGDFAKVDSNININFNPNGSKYNDNVIFNATLFDEYGNCLNGVSVEFYVEGVFIGSNVTDSNGIAIYNYVIGFVGNYNLTVVFNGNENYNYALDSVFGEFVKADGIINIDNIPKNMDINSKITIKGNLTDKDGNLLNGKYNLKINVTIGKNVYIHDVEVVNGLWSLKINNSKIGTTNVKIKLNDPNYESNKEFKYTVSKIKTIITVSAPKIIAGKKTNIVITLKDTDGKILKGKKLIIKSKYLKKPFKSTTNSKGQINIRVHASNIGKYTGTVEFAGDSIYAKSKKTITQIVTGLPDLTFSKIKRIKSSNYQLAVYTITIKNIGKGDSPKTQLYMQHWKYNGWKSKIMKVNIKAIGAGKSVNLTVKFLPDIGSHRTCKYQWFYINPLKNFKEISYKNNLKYLKP
ncbi:MAG: hypothetical protein LBM96_11170, partial [Methanobrevibacter sp.]|nr:hypothetical protein [Candidatus Methanoflexus mossambicus]